MTTYRVEVRFDVTVDDPHVLQDKIIELVAGLKAEADITCVWDEEWNEVNPWEM